MFDQREQIVNVSEYISPDGGVWTNYRTNKDAAFETADENGQKPWQENFAMPNAPEPTSSEANRCGLLSLVGNDAGIVPTDCKTKKAALCSLKSNKPEEKETGSDDQPSLDRKTPAPTKTKAPINSTTAATTPPTRKSDRGNTTEPIQLVVEGTSFTYYPRAIQFNSWAEACQYCIHHNDQQAAVFTSVSQLKTVLTELNTKAFWTGYSTNGQGETVSLDSEAPWIPEFALISALGNPKAMCGAASIGLSKKFGINWQPCGSKRTVLCSAKKTVPSQETEKNSTEMSK